MNFISGISIIYVYDFALNLVLIKLQSNGLTCAKSIGKSSTTDFVTIRNSFSSKMYGNL